MTDTAVYGMIAVSGNAISKEGLFMTNIFDITTFGAIGDGVTDNTRAIQAALDAAAECRGVVQVPPGNYMTGRLRLGHGVSLEGQSAWSFRSFGASVFTLNTDATDVFSLTAAELEGQLQTVRLTERLREHVPGFANCFISSIARACPPRLMNMI